MRKFVSLVLAVALVSAASAQSFTIRRPADGSTVRETVSVLIPEGSIPAGSYIGVIVNGKFIEAVSPKLEGDNYVYRLDTKARQIPDGDMDLEVVLYQNFAERIEVSNRSSVRVKLDNYTSIKIPEDGLRLRYKFRKGQELVYSNRQIQSAGMVSQAAAQLGSRAGEVPVDEETVRLLYTFDNVYPNGEALLRVQGLPDKGKNYAWLTPVGADQPKKYFDFQMHPLYMRIDPMGREVWGAIPPYFPLEGTSGESARTDLYALLPLPVLPEKALYPGDAWAAAHLFSTLNLDRRAETNKLTTSLTSRGTFLGAEWEKGIPCAKFSVAVDAGPRDLTNAVNLNTQPGEATRVQLQGIVWFSLDQGVIVKSDLTLLQESLVTVGTTQAAGAGAAGGGGGPSIGGAAGGGPSIGGAAGGAPGGSTGGVNFFFDPFVDDDGYLHFFRQGRRGGPPGDIGGDSGAAAAGSGFGGQGAGSPGFGQRTGGGSGGEQKMILRVRLRILTELEK